MPVIDNDTRKRKAAAILGSFGGASKSPRKSAAARTNGKLGGRPRKSEKSAN